jgi:hypothetical protein
MKNPNTTSICLAALIAINALNILGSTLITVVYFGASNTDKFVVYLQPTLTSATSTGHGVNPTASGQRTLSGQTTHSAMQTFSGNFSNHNLNQSRNFGLGATSTQ